jgi:heptosyltransferase-1
VIEQNLELIAGIAPIADSVRKPDPLLLPVNAEAEAWATALVTGPFAVLNPTAGWRAKEWQPARFGELARSLAANGLRSLVNCGPGVLESEIADHVVRASQGTAERVSCSIPQLISLTRRASLFVGGDTGPMHLADALRIPVVAIFGPTDPARNGPYFSAHSIVRSPASRTNYSHRDQPDPGIASITVAEVVAAAEKLLQVRA